MRVDGLLGFDFLAGTIADFDLDHARVTLYDPAAVEPNQGPDSATMIVDLRTTKPRFPIALDGDIRRRPSPIPARRQARRPSQLALQARADRYDEDECLRPYRCLWRRGLRRCGIDPRRSELGSDQLNEPERAPRAPGADGRDGLGLRVLPLLRNATFHGTKSRRSSPLKRRKGGYQGPSVQLGERSLPARRREALFRTSRGREESMPEPDKLKAAVARSNRKS